MNWGREYRKELEISDEQIEICDRSVFEYKAPYTQFQFDLFTDDTKDSYNNHKMANLIVSLQNKWRDNDAVIFRLFDESRKHNIIIWNKSEIPHYLQETLCPIYKRNVKKFSQSDFLDLVIYIRKMFEFWSVIIQKSDDEIEVSHILNSHFRVFENNEWIKLLNSYQKDVFKICPYENWYCKLSDISFCHFNWKIDKLVSQILNTPNIEHTKCINIQHPFFYKWKCRASIFSFSKTSIYKN